MSFTIQNSEGKSLGFLLMTHQGSFGECLFRLAPKRPHTSETRDSDVLQKLQALGKLKFLILNNVIIIRHPEIYEPIIIENNLLTVNEQQYQLVELNNS